MLKGTLSLNELSPSEQTLFELTITARTVITAIWIDPNLLTVSADILLYRKDAGGTHRQIFRSSDGNNILIGAGGTANLTELLGYGFGGSHIESVTNIKATMQSQGLGAGSVNVPWEIMFNPETSHVITATDTLIENCHGINGTLSGTLTIRDCVFNPGDAIDMGGNKQLTMNNCRGSLVISQASAGDFVNSYLYINRWDGILEFTGNSEADHSAIRLIEVRDGKGFFVLQSSFMKALQGVRLWGCDMEVVNNSPVTPERGYNGASSLTSDYTAEILAGIALTATQTSLTTLNSNLATVSGNLVTVDTVVDTLALNLATASGNLNTLRTNVNTTSGDVTTIKNNLITVSGNIVTVDTVVDTLALNLATSSGNLTTMRSNLTTVSGNLSVVTSDLATASGNITFGNKCVKNRQIFLVDGADIYLVIYDDNDSSVLVKQKLEKYGGGTIGSLVGTLTPSIRNKTIV